MADREPFRRFPLAVQTTYADLLARLEEDSVLDLHGSHVLKTRGGRRYWYAVHRLADRRIDRYIGPDSKETRAGIRRAEAVKDDLRQREKERSRLVRMCRESGSPSVDGATGKVLLALAKAGVFRLRGVLVGTHAFRCYPAMLGVEIPESRAVTEDIDVAAFRSVSIALDDRLDPALGDALRQIGPFDARPSLHKRPTAWRNKSSGALVELLTPNEGPDSDEPVELPALGAYATPLRFLDFLIHQPATAAVLYRSGVLVNVPRPAQYAIHKLIVATRRAQGATIKARKDIEQSGALIRVLAVDRPDELLAAFSDARNRGPSWRQAVEAGTRRLPADTREALAAAVRFGPLESERSRLKPPAASRARRPR